MKTIQQRIQLIIHNKNFPILSLLMISLLVGVFTFQNFGMTWDEYLYYKYADAIGYAYSIPAHLSPDFDLENAYGPSAWDHKNHGPGYLLFARLGVYALNALTNINQIELWHFVNFITFLVGVFFVYKISLRWLSYPAATSAAGLYLLQPVVWGHGFINPKDTPFATAFIAAIYFGLNLVDTISSKNVENKIVWREIIATGILIGLATNMRITGPLSGVIILFYSILKKQTKNLLWLISIAIIALLTTYITWPYIWNSPISTFIGTVRTMIAYPVSPKVLFLGDFYRSYELPRRYLPWLLGITLTEPVWPLFFCGAIVAVVRIIKKRIEWKSLSVTLFWFAFMVLYIVIARPPTYDGYRHFLFILPPVFIVCGFAFEEIYSRISSVSLYSLFTILLLTPGIIANIRLHPYEYTYYNSFVGGTKSVAGIYETDYWLTCYKEAVEQFNEIAPEGATLAVVREPRNAAYYAKDGIQVIDYIDRNKGDYLLLGARLNDVNRVLPQYPILLRVERNGATFCVVELVQ